jgi:hypothetical protein
MPRQPASPMQACKLGRELGASECDPGSKRNTTAELFTVAAERRSRSLSLIAAQVLGRHRPKPQTGQMSRPRFVEPAMPLAAAAAGSFPGPMLPVMSAFRGGFRRLRAVEVKMRTL